ncbi:MAG: hypothetical protein RhofKO_39830 [Rhodothermales bacterium]
MAAERITKNEQATLDELQAELDERQEGKDAYDRYQTALNGFKTYLINKYSIDTQADLLTNDGEIKRGGRMQMNAEERAAERQRKREARQAAN